MLCQFAMSTISIVMIVPKLAKQHINQLKSRECTLCNSEESKSLDNTTNHSGLVRDKLFK